MSNIDLQSIWYILFATIYYGKCFYLVSPSLQFLKKILSRVATLDMPFLQDVLHRTTKAAYTVVKL